MADLLSDDDVLALRSHNSDETLRQMVDLLKTELTGLDQAQEVYGRLEANIRLTAVINNLFTRILACFSEPGFENHSVIQIINERVQLRLELLADDTVFKDFGRVQLDFRAGMGPTMVYDSGLMGNRFFTIADASMARERIADYAVRIKPQLMAKLRKGGQDNFPGFAPGVGSLLAMTNPHRLPVTDRRVVSALATIYWLWGKYNKSHFLSLLPVKEEGYICRSGAHLKWADETFAGAKSQTDADSQALLLSTLERLLLQLDSYVGLSGPLESSLFQYKLGYEVCLPKIRERLVSGKTKLTYLAETELQRELCKFLIERNIFTYGMQIGPSEIDLQANYFGKSFVIETKIYKTSATARDVNSNITQLASYMDQQNLSARGVLVIYNLTNKTLIAERRWIRGRYWVVPINLGGKTASKRKKTLLISPGTGDELVSCVETTS